MTELGHPTYGSAIVRVLAVLLKSISSVELLCAMDKPNRTSPDSPGFSEPWKFSDVVLVVEGQKFHVHRSTLALWSPVFERMFTSDFKEKNSDEIQLPGKKASEVKELLQMMYPSLEETVITGDNCYFLLDLAREYQIASITRKCENFLVSAVKTRKQNDVLAVLIVGQNYELQTLIETCVHEARRLSLKELKHHTNRGEIDPGNYMQIAEGIINRLEEQCREVKASCSQKLLDSSRFLYNHVKRKPSDGLCFPITQSSPTAGQYLNAVSTIESGLSGVAKHLKELKATLETLP